MSRFVLVPSPFVGAGAWRGAADALPDAVAVDYGVVRGPDWYGHVGRQVVAQAGEGQWIAVLHSGAGGFAPVIAAMGRPAGFIFVDAIMPHPGRSVLDTAPDTLVAQLRALTSDGLLAPWNRWFGEDPTPRMIPDEAARADFVADLPRTPFAFLEAGAPDDRAWEEIPTAYLQLSKGYEATAEKAAGRGWPVRQVRMNHLAMAAEPAVVARELAHLAEELARA